MDKNDNQIDNAPRFLVDSPEYLAHYCRWSAVITIILIAMTIFAPFKFSNMWIYLGLWILTLASIIIFADNAIDFNKSNLLISYEYLVFSIPDSKSKDHKKLFFLLDKDHLAKAYKLFGPKSDKIVNENRKLAAQHLFDKNVIEGMQKAQHHIAGAYFIMNKDNSFYYDDDLQAIQTFTSEKAAQVYVNQHIPTFDGKIMYIPIALDGEVKNWFSNKDKLGQKATPVNQIEEAKNDD